MPSRIAFDTNLLVYADGGGVSAEDVIKQFQVFGLIENSIKAGLELFVPAQVLVELYDVLLRKRKLSREQAKACIENWRLDMMVAQTSDAVLDNALLLATRHTLRIFDAVILAAAAEARCDILYTEDLQHGFVWRGVEVVNPFL